MHLGKWQRGIYDALMLGRIIPNPLSTLKGKAATYFAGYRRSFANVCRYAAQTSGDERLRVYRLTDRRTGRRSYILCDEYVATDLILYGPYREVVEYPEGVIL